MKTANFLPVREAIVQNIRTSLSRIKSFLSPDITFTPAADEADPLTFDFDNSNDAWDMTQLEALGWDGVSNVTMTITNVRSITLPGTFTADLTVYQGVTVLHTQAVAFTSAQNIGTHPVHPLLAITFSASNIIAGQEWSWECGPYLTTVKAVYAVNANELNFDEYPAVAVWADREDASPGPTHGSGTLYSREMDVAIVGAIRGEYTDPGHELSNLAHDISTAMHLDTTRGGYAIDTHEEGIEPFLPEDSISAVICRFRIQYRNYGRKPREYN